MAPKSVRSAIRVMVVGSNPVVCAGLVSLLDGDEDMRVVAVGSTATQCRDVETDVAVVGLAGFAFDEATRTVGRLRARTDTKLVVVIDAVDEVLGWVVAARADACVDLAAADPHKLVDIVRAVMSGQTITSAELLSELRERERAMAPGCMLTPRERDVLTWLAEGQSNESIARQLGLQVGTIRMHVSMILAKLGVTNRTEAAVVTLRHGLLDSGTRPTAAKNEIATTTPRKAGAPTG